MFKNRVTEKDIRCWLDRNGYFGRSAKITDLELHAVKRPGWRQVFRFTMQAKRRPLAADVDGEIDNNLNLDAGEWKLCHGIVLDDQRRRTESAQTRVFVFDTLELRNEKLDEWSVDMLTCSSGQNQDMVVLTAVVTMFVIIALILGSWIGD